MDWKTRVPRLRTFLLTIMGLFVFLLALFHYQARTQLANSKASGLASVAGSWDPISTFSQSHRVSIKRVALSGQARGRSRGESRAVDDGIVERQY